MEQSEVGKFWERFYEIIAFEEELKKSLKGNRHKRQIKINFNQKEKNRKGIRILKTNKFIKENGNLEIDELVRFFSKKLLKKREKTQLIPLGKMKRGVFKEF